MLKGHLDAGNNASRNKEQLWAFNRPASYRSGAKVGKPDHRNRILQALSDSFKLTKPISLLGSLEISISEQASAWSRKMKVSKKKEEKHAPQVVTSGKLSCIFEFRSYITLHQKSVANGGSHVFPFRMQFK